jgi:uncharacterized protein YqjF (DUF2071 family)
LFDSEIPAARGRARSERETFAKDLQRNAGRCSNGTRLHRYLKARSGAKTRPKARRREQGTEVKLCPLRLDTTEGALRKEARFNSAANGPAAHAQQSTQQRKQRRAGLRTEPDCTEVKGNPTSNKEAQLRSTAKCWSLDHHGHAR